MTLKALIKRLVNNLDIIIPLLILPLLYILLYKFYIPRANAFGCFDDCFNFVGGYFLLNGKEIYSDFIFNHQPLPAFVSMMIQYVANPASIFELVLKHRQFLMLFNLAMGALLIIRFRLPALFFIILFEISKFYLYGDRFLAEGIIVYPVVYLFGLAIIKLSKEKIYPIDLYFAPLLSWYIVFSREPYAPLGLLLYFVILIGKIDRVKKISVSIFTILTLITFGLFGFNIKDYFFNVVTFNLQAVLPYDTKADMWGNRFIQSFFYPIYIFFYASSSFFGQFLAALNIFFFVFLGKLLYEKKIKIAALIFVSLGIANLRVVIPGTVFYEAFHLLIWFALFVFTITYFGIKNLKLPLKITCMILFIGLALWFTSSKQYFAQEKISTHEEFVTNLGHILQMGEVVRILGNSNDTLFLDRSEDLIYWQAKLPTAYKYSWYTSQMNYYDLYKTERLNMFKKNPPTFYKEYGACPKKADPNDTIPDFARGSYVRLLNNGRESCLFVRIDKLKDISEIQWKKAQEMLYTLPKQ